MNIIAIQFDIAWEDKPGNFEVVRRLISRAAPEGGALVVLPEMFATGFSMNAAILAEPENGRTGEFLSAAAREFGIFLVAGAAIREPDGRSYNKALAFAPDGTLAARYAKMRPFSPGGESQHYAAGERPAFFSWGDCTVSPFVCYDLRFPEIFREAAAARRPELLVVIANWPDKRSHHWVRLLQARAIENQAYVVGVNRTGSDPHYTYAGRSLIADPHGEILADAGTDEGIIAAKMDLPNLRKYRSGLPFLDDLRIAAP